MAKGTLTIKILGDVAGIKKAFGDVEKSSTGLSGKLGGLGGALGKVGLAFGGLTIAYKAVDFFKESAQASMEDAKAKAVLHAAIKNLTKATDAELESLDAYIEKTQAATGFTEEELRPAMIKLTEATKDVSKAQELLVIAMDVSTARGISLETVALALEKAQNGQLTSLQRLGVATKDASGAALSFDQILQNLASTYGGTTAAAADTLGGKMERMKLIFGEVKESIGASLMPAFEKIATVIVDNLPTFEALGAMLGEVAAQVLELVAPIIEALMPALKSLMELWRTIWPLLKAVLAAVAPAIGNILSGVADAINIIVRSITWLLTKIGILKKEATSAINLGAAAVAGLSKPLPNKGIQGGLVKEEGGWIPGSGPVPVIAHGGEYVLTKADMTELGGLLAGAISGSGGGMGGGNTEYLLTAILKAINDQPAKTKQLLRTA